MDEEKELTPRELTPRDAHTPRDAGSPIGDPDTPLDVDTRAPSSPEDGVRAAVEGFEDGEEAEHSSDADIMMAAADNSPPAIDKNEFDPKRIFVGRLVKGMSAPRLQDIVERHFSSFGVVERIVLPVDSHTGLPKGFSFITFTESSAVELVLSCPHVIDEVEVDCKPAFPRNSTKSLHDLAGVPGTLFKTRKLFVAGLPTTVTDSELVNHYSRYGQVLSGRVIKDKRSGHSRGFGFVEFATEAAVDKTMANFSSHHLGGKWVMSKRASMNPPKERPSSLANMMEPAVRAAVVRALSASFSVPRGYHDYDYRRGSPPRRPYHRGCYHDHGRDDEYYNRRPREDSPPPMRRRSRGGPYENGDPRRGRRRRLDDSIDGSPDRMIENRRGPPLDDRRGPPMMDDRRDDHSPDRRMHDDRRGSGGGSYRYRSSGLRHN